ncbi:MAG: phosphatidate cytidylyltransferase [Hyphomicrobiales bacterium]
MSDTPASTNALAETMSARPELTWLFVGIFGLLMTASIVSFLLKTFAKQIDHKTLENLQDRINSWWVMIGLLVFVCLLGRTATIVFFAICSFMALREFLTLSDTRKGDHWSLILMFFVALPLQYWLIGISYYGVYSIFVPVYCFLLLPVIAALRGDTTRFFERVAKVQWALMICVFCLSHVPALLNLTIPGFGERTVMLIVFLLLVVQLSDVMQYVWGKLFGKKLIAPSLSPSKTWVGFFGGVASASLVGAALFWITPFNPWQAGLISIVITVMGFLGGLVMSAIKRDCGVKDWGHTIRGHGGFLDRLDSVVFAAPIFFHVTRFFYSTS